MGVCRLSPICLGLLLPWSHLSSDFSWKREFDVYRYMCEYVCVLCLCVCVCGGGGGGGVGGCLCVE